MSLIYYLGNYDDDSYDYKDAGNCYEDKSKPTFITVGFTPETFYQELETEETTSSITREEFFKEFNTHRESSISFQALYNYMSDQYVLEQFIARCTTNRLGTQKTNPIELGIILKNWLHGLSTPDNLNITDARALEYRKRYYSRCKRRYGFPYYKSCNDYTEYSKWLKKNK
jgi:hypothetical protein